MKINSKLFKEISFFMGGSKVVNSLEAGAIENGGATLMGNGQVISNIEKDNFISINKNNNVLRLFIPKRIIQKLRLIINPIFPTIVTISFPKNTY